MNTGKLARMGILTALALILNFIERLFPPLMAFAPGSKIGLGNIVTLIAIITLGHKEAFLILVVRCVLGSLFGGNIFGLVYSLGGGISAFVVMALMYEYLSGRVSLIAISISGAVVHNSVQTFIASLVVSQINYLLLLPFMLIASVLAGVAVGASAYFTVKAVPNHILFPIEKG